ncbi:hypothetical protein [Micromonospora sp. C95]|uniref:hypothetical protein n=1 Tax=Micromonospora sp. C95 TaxID=2824882 RepID=UPI001B3851F3|nr:hypothetical protein [Micromonospora sp. C95]MBQ1026023.1 hypothetical protein [Micromonospora sp. C95]
MKNPAGDDLTWVLTHGTGATWQFAMAVQSGLEDVDAAYDDGDWAVCVESCAAALRAVVYCGQVAHGYVGPPTEVERSLEIAFGTGGAIEALRSLPVPVGATRADADTARRLVTGPVADLRSRLPFEVPVMRSAAGYFPTVRIGRDIERLRAAHGLPPLDWNQWEF